MKLFVKHTVAGALALAGLAATSQALADITFYEQHDFGGASAKVQRSTSDLAGSDFDNRASSAIVTGGRWEVCDDTRFRGDCTVLRPGQYANLASMGMNNRISSARSLAGNVRVSDDRYAPTPLVSDDYRRRNNERLYDADVVAVRAVVGTPQQRCWVEKENVTVEGNNNAVPGGIAGAVIGGILGHQIGGGTGRALATVGGAIGGGALGARVGSNYGGNRTRTQDVQRCETTTTQSRPEYWDVTYTFRGQTHTAQMTAPPGATIKVDSQGVPRA